MHLARRLIDALRDCPGTDLSNPNFSNPEDQIACVRRWNKERSWGFSARAFRRLPPAPATTSSASRAVVLVPFLDTPQQTLIELWTVIAESSAEAWSNERLVRSEDVRLLPGLKYQPGLRWCVLDLTAHADSANPVVARNVRSSLTSGHGEVLAAAAQHPNWLRSASCEGPLPLAVIGGYQVRNDDGAWSLVPALFTWAGSERACLNVVHDSKPRTMASVPVVRAGRI